VCYIFIYLVEMLKGEAISVQVDLDHLRLQTDIWLKHRTEEELLEELNSEIDYIEKIVKELQKATELEAPRLDAIEKDIVDAIVTHNGKPQDISKMLLLKSLKERKFDTERAGKNRCRSTLQWRFYWRFYEIVLEIHSSSVAHALRGLQKNYGSSIRSLQFDLVFLNILLGTPLIDKLLEPITVIPVIKQKEETPVQNIELVDKQTTKEDPAKSIPIPQEKVELQPSPPAVATEIPSSVEIIPKEVTASSNEPITSPPPSKESDDIKPKESEVVTVTNAKPESEEPPSKPHSNNEPKVEPTSPPTSVDTPASNTANNTEIKEESKPEITTSAVEVKPEIPIAEVSKEVPVVAPNDTAQATPSTPEKDTQIATSMPSNESVPSKEPEKIEEPKVGTPVPKSPRASEDPTTTSTKEASQNLYLDSIPARGIGLITSSPSPRQRSVSTPVMPNISKGLRDEKVLDYEVIKAQREELDQTRLEVSVRSIGDCIGHSIILLQPCSRRS
jgi:hypothetical protein